MMYPVLQATVAEEEVRVTVYELTSSKGSDVQGIITVVIARRVIVFSWLADRRATPLC